MAQNKIALYYAFAPVSDPEAVRLWQRALCEKLGLTGRILISKHGINGTVGGPLASVKEYVRTTKAYPGFGEMDVKYSEGSAADFPRLSVKARDEIVAFGAPDELKVDENGVVGGGTHLSPQGVHELIEEKAEEGKEVVFFDGRNAFEAQIGKFKNAVVPDVETTHDFIAEIESGKYDHLKDQPVIAYCTGGIRCEILSALMINRGFQDVYQIKGGIVRYGETFGDDGLWEGSLYVFDKRMNMDFSEDAKLLAECTVCGTATKELRNCSDPGCRTLKPYCPEHTDTSERPACETCQAKAASVTADAAGQAAQGAAQDAPVTA